MGVNDRGLVIGRCDAATGKDSAAGWYLAEFLADGSCDFKFLCGHFPSISAGDDQTKKRRGSPAVYFGGDDRVSIVPFVLCGLSLYDRGNEVWRSRSNPNRLLCAVNLPHRVGRGEPAVYFADLGLRVY